MKKVISFLGLVIVLVSFQACTDEAEQVQELHEQSIALGDDGQIDDEDETEY